jgi:hypothetical protein
MILERNLRGRLQSHGWFDVDRLGELWTKKLMLSVFESSIIVVCDTWLLQKCRNIQGFVKADILSAALPLGLLFCVKMRIHNAG